MCIRASIYRNETDGCIPETETATFRFRVPGLHGCKHVEHCKSVEGFRPESHVSGDRFTVVG